MQTKLLREIKIALPNLRKSEVKVAEFIFNKPSAIIELTTAQASNEIGVSEPTLIRFCKAVNFDGFQKFKLTLAQQLAADDYFNSYEINAEDSIQELTEKVFDSTISEILNVRSQLDQETLEEAIETLANANRVEFYAFGGSVPVHRHRHRYQYRPHLGDLRSPSSIHLNWCENYARNPSRPRDCSLSVIEPSILKLSTNIVTYAAHFRPLFFIADRLWSKRPFISA